VLPNSTPKASGIPETCPPKVTYDVAMPTARANGIDLYYEVTGHGRPLVLVMGIGAQLVAWPQGFIDLLVAHDFQVILFDNRDVGLSQKIDDAGRPPPVRTAMARAMFGLPIDAPYSLVDMADDVAGLLDHLGLDDAHVAGVSLGGMVAQTLAITHPGRLRTLTSIMSHTGDRFTGIGSPRALQALLGPAPRNPAEAGERAVNFTRICGSTGFPIDEDDIRRRAAAAYERCFYPRGFVRQFLATLATGSRTAALRFVRTPTLVMHGSADTLLPPRGGRATARAIPGARFQLIEGMGHDLPRGAWPILADAIAEHARSADQLSERRSRSAGVSR
jgi:pimeloyl-ACP methyl ester carboxylesterase